MAATTTGGTWPTAAAGAPCTPLPGSRLELDPDATELEPGLLAGGVPFRLLRLEPRARALLARWQSGELLGDAASERALARRLLDARFLTQIPPAAPFDMADVTIVIPVVDRSADLDRLLAALRGITAVVVDDASDDPTTIAAVAARHGASLVRLDARSGPSAARNHGMAAVCSPVTCFLDSDVIVDSPGFLDQLLVHLAVDDVAVVAPRIVGPEGTTLLERFEHLASPLDMGPVPALVGPGSRVPYVPSAALVVRTSIGPAPFDEALHTGEDVDLVWRLAVAGHRVVYDPRAVLCHPARADVAAWLDQRRSYGASATSLHGRHGDAVAPIAGAGLIVSAVGAALLGFPVVAFGSIAVASERLSRRLRGQCRSPRRQAAHLVARHVVDATPMLARQVLRSFAPILLVAAMASSRARRALLGILIVSAVERRRRLGPDATPAVLAVAVVDDLAYAGGLWQSVLTTRQAGALRPRLVWRQSSATSSDRPRPRT